MHNNYDGAATPGLAALEAAELPRPCIAPAQHCGAFDAALRRRIKRLIVFAGCWGFPATAHWLIDKFGLKHD